MNKGPRGRWATAGLPKFNQIDKKVVKRLLSYIFKDYKLDSRAVSQNVKTRLLSFYGDCFFDEDFDLVVLFFEGIFNLSPG